MTFERNRFKFYLPFMTNILITSAPTFVLSAALWLGSHRAESKTPGEKPGSPFLIAIAC